MPNVGNLVHALTLLIVCKKFPPSAPLASAKHTFFNYNHMHLVAQNARIAKKVYSDERNLFRNAFYR